MLTYIHIAFTVLFSQNLLLIFAFAFGNNPKTFLKTKYAFYTSLSLTLVLLLLAPLSRLLSTVLTLVGMEYLSLLGNTLLATMGTYFIGVILQKVAPQLWQLTAESFRSLPTNGGVIAVLLLCEYRGYNLMESMFFALFGGLGVMAALISLVSVRQNLEFQHTPRYFQGIPIFFITAGLMSLSLIGFYGLSFR